MKEFKLEYYLEIFKCLSGLHLIFHDLYIEKGRHHKPKIACDQCICLLCSQDIEDELNFVMKCPVYQFERSTLLNVMDRNDRTILNDDEKITFYNLMMSQNECINFGLAKYLYKCFKERQQISG